MSAPLHGGPGPARARPFQLSIVTLSPWLQWLLILLVSVILAFTGLALVEPSTLSARGTALVWQGPTASQITEFQSNSQTNQGAALGAAEGAHAGKAASGDCAGDATPKIIAPLGSGGGPPCSSPAALEAVRMWERFANLTLDRVMPNLAAAWNGSSNGDGVAGDASASDGRVWLQIGANTMDALNTKNDPLLEFLGQVPAWRKFFVEPVPQLYAKLVESVQRWPNSRAVNLAISPNATIEETVAEMFCLGEAFQEERLDKDLPYWANQICSFDPGHIGRHFPGKPVQPVNVTAVSVARLLSTLGVAAVDVLLIDTEGFDAQVMRQVPFGAIRPQLVLWEHKHLRGEDRGTTEDYMRERCYAVFQADHENTAGLALPLLSS